MDLLIWATILRDLVTGPTFNLFWWNEIWKNVLISIFGRVLKDWFPTFETKKPEDKLFVEYIDYFGIGLGTYFFSKDVFLWVLFKTNKGKIAHSGLGLKNGRVRKCEADSSHEWLLTPWPQKLHFCSQTSLLVCSSSSAHWTEIAKNCSKIPYQRCFMHTVCQDV